MSLVNNPSYQQRKRLFHEANLTNNIKLDGTNNNEEEEYGLVHSVSGEFGGGLQQPRGGKRQKQQRSESEDVIMTEDDAPTVGTTPSAADDPSNKEQQRQQESVVPLSMQLFRPFWALSCCPDCDADPMGTNTTNHHQQRHRMQQYEAMFTGGVVDDSPRTNGTNNSSSGDGGGALDSRLRSVSMASFKGIGIGTSGGSTSASSTITGDPTLRQSLSKVDHFRSNSADDEDEEEVNEGEIVANNNATFLPSSSSSLESTTKHSPSSSSGVLLDDNMHRNNSQLLLTHHSTPQPTSSTIISNKTVTIEQLLHEYTTACKIYGCHTRINPGVLTTLRYRLPTLRVSANFFDADMLALTEVLLRYCNGALSYITRLDFSVAAKEGRASSYGGGSGNGKKGFRSHGAYALAKVLGMSECITEVYLSGNRVGPFGAAAIFSSIGRNEKSVLKTLLMRGCRIGERGALSFVSSVLEDTEDLYLNKHTEKKKRGIVLEEVDFSANRIGFNGCYEIERALKASCSTMVRTTSSASALDVDSSITSSSSSSSSSSLSSPSETITTVWTPSGVKISAVAHSLHIDLEANLVFQEVMNCITHGLGIILAIIGAFFLSSVVKDQPSHYISSCAIYSTSLVVLFTCSTLYHSFFALTRTRFIFRVFDRAAIYMLMIGSYSPLLNIALYNRGYTKLLWAIYICGTCGIITEATLWKWKHKPKFSLAMYLGMGWSCLVCLPDLMKALPVEAVWLLAGGGVTYTAGVPFFVRNTNLDHSIWHVFVLVGAVLHWLLMYFYVARLPTL